MNALPPDDDDSDIIDELAELEVREELSSKARTSRLIRSHEGSLCDSQGHSIGIRLDEQV